MHDITLQIPRISSLAMKMYLEGNGQDWRAVEDRACMKLYTYAICGKEARKIGLRERHSGLRPQAPGFEGKLISKDKDFLGSRSLEKTLQCYMTFNFMDN